MEIDYFGQMGDAEHFNPRNYGFNEHYHDWDFEAREGSPLEFFSDIPNPILTKIIKKHPR